MFIQTGWTDSNSSCHSCDRSTCSTDRLHHFSVTIPRYYQNVYVNSLFSCTTRLWTSLPMAFLRPMICIAFSLSGKLSCIRDLYRDRELRIQSFFKCFESNTILLQFFYEPHIIHVFQKIIIRFLKLTKLRRK